MLRLTPAELDEALREQLLAMKVAPEVTERFATHPQFSPRHKVAIVAHLDFLRGTDNRALLVESMLAARSETDALSYEYLVRMLAYYHEHYEAIARIEMLAALPIAVTESGRLLIVMPVDYIYWNRENDEVFAALAKQLSARGFEDRQVLVDGTLSNRAKEGLRAHGFSYAENFLNLAVAGQ
jgi:hypothetical protein